jgi:anti-sigma-K factor RskA
MSDEMTVKNIRESVISNVGFWQGLVVALISVCTTLGVIFVTAGGTLARLAQVEKDQTELKQAATIDRSNTQNSLQRIEDRMVDKEDFKELRQDVKNLTRQEKR